MKITIDFNGLGEIHAPESQSIVEEKIVRAAAKKLPREIQKVEYEINKLTEFKWHLENMNRTMENWKEEVIITSLTR